MLSTVFIEERERERERLLICEKISAKYQSWNKPRFVCQLCIQRSRFNKINKFYCFIGIFLSDSGIFFFPGRVLRYRIQWLLVPFGAKAPALLPTIASAPSLQMWIQWKSSVSAIRRTVLTLWTLYLGIPGVHRQYFENWCLYYSNSTETVDDPS